MTSQADYTEDMDVLILSRRRDERIIINENITVMVVAICGDKVKLGIEADKSIPVHREEVQERIRENRRRQRP